MRAAPKIGDFVTVHGRKARIFKIHRAGTIDVQMVDGAKEAYRITGLPTHLDREREAALEDPTAWEKANMPRRNPSGPRGLGPSSRPSGNRRFGRQIRRPYYREGQSPAEIRGNPQHVHNLNSVVKLKRAGFQGPDASLVESLGEYGLAWKDLGDETLFIYRHPSIEGKFDRVTLANNTDIFREYNWVDWDQFFSANGSDKEDFSGYPLVQQIFDLANYYGLEEIFGTSYWEGFSISGLD